VQYSAYSHFAPPTCKRLWAHYGPAESVIGSPVMAQTSLPVHAQRQKDSCEMTDLCLGRNPIFPCVSAYWSITHRGHGSYKECARERRVLEIVGNALSNGVHAILVIGSLGDIPLCHRQRMGLCVQIPL